MDFDVLDIFQTLITLVLIPIWKAINDLKLMMAKDYVTKTDCQTKHKQSHEETLRIHERIDSIRKGGR